MDELRIKSLIDSIDYNDLEMVRKESGKKLRAIRRRDRVFFTIYLQKEYVENFEKARDWAFSKGIIARKTRWAFTKFAITNIIDMVMKEIEKEWIDKENAEMVRRASNTNPFNVSPEMSG